MSVAEMFSDLSETNSAESGSKPYAPKGVGCSDCAVASLISDKVSTENHTKESSLSNPTEEEAEENPQNVVFPPLPTTRNTHYDLKDHSE